MEAGTSPAATPSYGLEVLPVPVTDVDRAITFYADLLGFHVDVDYRPTAAFRVVQLTPRGSATSIQVGVGVTTAVPGSLQGLTLVVTDLVGTHALLTERGVAIGPVRHKASVEGWLGDFEPGPDPARRDYASFTDLTDPDGNAWVLQERGYDADRRHHETDEHDLDTLDRRRKDTAMGLSWQQGPLGRGPVGRFLTPEPLPERLLYAEPLRRRMRVRFGGEWIADSEDVLLLHEPGRYPVALFPLADVTPSALEREDRVTHHADLGDTAWFTVAAGGQSTPRAAWHYAAPPSYADVLAGRVAFAWRAMEAFYEEDERIVGHAADPYHRIDIRQTSRHLVVRDGERVIADTTRPLALYESGFAPRWYVPRDDVDETALRPDDTQTFCPYKGLAGYYDIGDQHHAAWSYRDAWPEVGRVSDLVSFEADKVEVYLDGERQSLEPGQTVVAHGVDRGLDPDEILARAGARS